MTMALSTHHCYTVHRILYLSAVLFTLFQVSGIYTKEYIYSRKVDYPGFYCLSPCWQQSVAEGLLSDGHHPKKPYM